VQSAHDALEVAARTGSQAVFRGQGRRPRELALVLVRDRLVAHQQAVAVEARDGRHQRVTREAVTAQRVAHEPRDPDAGGARPEDHHLSDLSPAIPVARAPASMPATATAAVPWMSSLKERTSPVAVEQAEGVRLLEVLPLQQARGKRRCTACTNSSTRLS
jgi:hypothetical protein